MSTAPKLSLVAALAQNRVMGRANALPWHLPNDLKRFKALTMGKPVVMGRKTYESIGKPLPGRRNLVLSRSKTLSGVETFRSLDALFEELRHAPELFIIGGAGIFEATLPLANKLYLTFVENNVEGDVYFPEFDVNAWQETTRETHCKDPQHEYDYTFVDYERSI